MACPYCNSDESCEHHLLSVDILEHEALGGALYELFDARWKTFRPKAEEHDEDFDEESFPDGLEEAFSSCLEEAEKFATKVEIEEFDTMWGMGVSSQQHLYCSTAAEVDAALQQYQKFCDVRPTL